MFFERYLENFVIYGENISWFYVFCALVSFFAVWFTRHIEPKTSTSGSGENVAREYVSTDNSDSSVSGNNDRKALLKSIEETLSHDEKEKESETEKQQLLDILELMKNDEKFNSVTMEELEEQLKLYRG